MAVDISLGNRNVAIHVDQLPFSQSRELTHDIPLQLREQQDANLNLKALEESQTKNTSKQDE